MRSVAANRQKVKDERNESTGDIIFPCAFLCAFAVLIKADGISLAQKPSLAIFYPEAAFVRMLPYAVCYLWQAPQM